MKVEYKNKYDGNIQFGNLMIGDVFEYDDMLFIKIAFADDETNNDDAFSLTHNYRLHFESNVYVKRREFILKEV